MSDYWGDEGQPVCPILERSMSIGIHKIPGDVIILGHQGNGKI